MTNLTTMFLGLLIGLVLGAGAVLAYLQYKAKAENQRSVVESIESSDEKVLTWLNEFLQTYKKECIAYHLEKLRVKKHLWDDQVKGLQQMYGKVLVEPVLMVNQEYMRKFSDWTKLIEAEKKWLQKRNESVEDEKHLSKKIQSILIEASSAEASEIFEHFCRQNAIVLDGK